MDRWCNIRHVASDTSAKSQQHGNNMVRSEGEKRALQNIHFFYHNMESLFKRNTACLDGRKTMTEQKKENEVEVVSHSTELIQDYTPCENLKLVRRSIAIPRGTSSVVGYNAIASNIHNGIVTHQTMCQLIGNNENPLCKHEQKTVGDAVVKEVRLQQEDRRDWTTRRSVEQGVNKKRMRVDAMWRSACAVVATHRKQLDPLTMPNVRP